MNQSRARRAAVRSITPEPNDFSTPAATLTALVTASASP